MRTTGSSRDTTWPVVRQAGIRLLYQRGFAAMNLRDLAREAGLKPGSLYNYFDSKEQFLYLIVSSITEEITEDVSAKVARAFDVKSKVDIFVQAHIEWYTLRREEVFIGNMEMRSLSEENFKKFVGIRKRYERILIDIIEQGVSLGRFRMVDATVTAFSLISMLSGMSNWYRPSGRISLLKLIAMHIDLVHGMLGICDPTEARAHQETGSGQ
jgi:AcrR family transcriptional regulator